MRKLVKYGKVAPRHMQPGHDTVSHDTRGISMNGLTAPRILVFLLLLLFSCFSNATRAEVLQHV